MTSIRVKICGITRPIDAISAVKLGADAIGFVFDPTSKRAVSIADANAIIRELPPFITKVGLFVDASSKFIKSILEEVDINLLQFHGEESQADCICYSKPYIKAIKIQEKINLQERVNKFDGASGVVLDSFVSGIAGGTGQTFNWDLIDRGIKKPIILAGGLNPDNVYDAIQRVKPYAVDVSSGVESEPGIKDHKKLMKFIRRAKGLL